MTHQVHIGDGRIRLPRELCDAFLADAAGAALLHREGRAYLVPLALPGAGGLLLKRRNARGDRVLAAPDFLAGCGLGQFTPEREFVAHWVEDAGALWIEGLAETGNLVCTRKPG
jgi:hypothetical protein